MNTEENQHRARSEGGSDELKHSEAKLRTIIDTIPVIAWCGLPDGSAKFWNRRWHNYTGICLEDATGCGCRAAIHPEDLEQSQTPAAYYKLPHPQCSAPELLLSANLYLRSTVDTALEIWQQLSSERD
jgi:PAS domain-containing protein